MDLECVTITHTKITLRGGERDKKGFKIRLAIYQTLGYNSLGANLLSVWIQCLDPILLGHQQRNSNHN